MEIVRTRLLITLIALPLVSQAQEWLTRLPKKSPDEYTFTDFKSAFESYYRERPVAVRSEEVEPAGNSAPANFAAKKAIEEHKQYKRWEWFTEPRVYPTGRWNNQKIVAELQRVPAIDAQSIAKLKSPLPTIPVWRALGPFDAVGGTNLGRLNAIAVLASNPKSIYIGAAAGGIWKSTDAGSTWATTTDSMPTLSIADIALDPTNANNLYIATGDAFGYGNPFWGGTYSVGVWKSSNAGSTWTVTGLSFNVAQNRTIRRLAIHPTNPNILLAATSAGLFRTTDGGATWSTLWNDSTFDAEFDPSNGNIVYTTTTQVKKSTNAGASWSNLTATCAGARYNIEVAKSNPKTLYTLCTNGTVQKSTDSGGTWSVTSAPGVTLYGYYDNILAVSPVDPKIVIVAGFNIRKTTDGGSTWANVATAGHVDNHAFTFAPGSSTTIYAGNDGGLFRTTNGGTSWSSLNKGLSITQFYRIGPSKITSSLLVAGAQDNGNMKLNAGAWTNITNADGMGGFIDFSNDNNVYATIQYGTLYRSTNGGASWTGINTPASGAWVTPFIQDKGVANTIYAGTDKVYKSTNQGTTWTAISGVLAGASPLTILKIHSNSKFLLAGSGGKLYRTTNGGTSWTDITGALPAGSNYLTDAEMAENDPQIIWATFSGYNAGQKVYKSTNGGSTWTNISGTLPNLPVNCVVSEKKANNPIYVGTDVAVYYRNDTIADFAPYKSGLPNVIIDQLQIHVGAGKIRAATYGRGVWEGSLHP